MKASNWIDRVKAAKGWDSDYKAAKELGMTRSGMSSIRTGDSATLSEETAIKVAEILGINPAGVILDQVAQRIKSAPVRAALSREVERLCILCKVICATYCGADRRMIARATA